MWLKGKLICLHLALDYMTIIPVTMLQNIVQCKESYMSQQTVLLALQIVIKGTIVELRYACVYSH